jgi:hypothetical protein
MIKPLSLQNSRFFGLKAKFLKKEKIVDIENCSYAKFSDSIPISYNFTKKHKKYEKLDW